MHHAQLQVDLSAGQPVVGVAEDAPIGPVFGQDAFGNGGQALFWPGAFVQAELFVKNVVTRAVHLPVDAAHFKNAQPAQPTGQRKAQQALAQGLVGGVQLAHILVVAGDAHQGIVVGRNAPPAATHVHHAPAGVVVGVTHFVHAAVTPQVGQGGFHRGAVAAVHPLQPEAGAGFGRHARVRTQQSAGNAISAQAQNARTGIKLNDPQPHIGSRKSLPHPGAVLLPFLPAVFGHPLYSSGWKWYYIDFVSAAQSVRGRGRYHIFTVLTPGCHARPCPALALRGREC